MRKPLVSTNIPDRITGEAFNLQVRQFLRFLRGRINEMVERCHGFEEHEIQSELREIASEGGKTTPNAVEDSRLLRVFGNRACWLRDARVGRGVSHTRSGSDCRGSS